MTNGMFVIRKNNVVIMKIIAGCDGYNIHEMYKAIEENPVINALDACIMANSFKVGCDDCLVVISEATLFTKCKEPIPETYRETFSDPTFNPRREMGEVDEYKLLDRE